MRFCQELGFSGFSQMQRLFRDEYTRKWPDYSTRLQNLRAAGESRPEVLLAEFVEAGRASLEKLMTTVDTAMLDRAVDILAAAPLIHLVGYRRSFPVASYLAYALEKMAVPCVLHAGVGLLATGHARAPRRRGPRHHLRALQRRDRRLRRGRPRRRHTRSSRSPTASRARCSGYEVTPLLVSEVDVGAFRALSATFALAIALAVAVGARREADRRRFAGSQNGTNILFWPASGDGAIRRARQGGEEMPKLDVITIGRSSVDLYGAQVGGRLEDMALASTSTSAARPPTWPPAPRGSA